MTAVPSRPAADRRARQGLGRGLHRERPVLDRDHRQARPRAGDRRADRDRRGVEPGGDGQLGERARAAACAHPPEIGDDAGKHDDKVTSPPADLPAASHLGSDWRANPVIPAKAEPITRMGAVPRSVCRDRMEEFHLQTARQTRQGGGLHPPYLTAPETSPSVFQTNSMIAATKHRIFAMTFSASGSGSAGKAKPNAAQTANTTNIPATA